MTVHNLSEFINDDRFITKKQRATYLKQGVLKDNNKKAVCKAFERYYESCVFLRKKKRHEQQIELGKEREHRIENDKRTSRQTTVMASIIKQAVINFRNEIDDLDEKIYEGYYYNTVFNWLLELNLLSSDNLKLCYYDLFKSPDERLLELENDIDTFIKTDLILKQYIDTKKYIFKRAFAQALKNECRKRYRLVTYKIKDNKVKASGSRFMSDEEQAKYEQWEAEMSKRSDVEKPKPFRKINAKNEEWLKCQADFLDFEFRALRIYQTWGISIEQVSESKVIEIDHEQFEKEFKMRCDQITTNLLFKKFVYLKKQEWKMRMLDDCEKDDIKEQLFYELESVRNEIRKFDELDLKNKLGVRSEETNTYIKEKEKDIHNELCDYIDSKNSNKIEYTQEQIIELIEKGEL